MDYLKGLNEDRKALKERKKALTIDVVLLNKSHKEKELNDVSKELRKTKKAIFKYIEKYDNE